MARLIIGHTTHNAVTIWVRGDPKHPIGFVTCTGPQDLPERVIELEERHGYTGVVQIDQLTPQTSYDVQVAFGSTLQTGALHRVDFGHCRGTFTTFPAPLTEVPLTFLVGSCNLHSIGFLSPPDPAFMTLLSIADQEKPHFMMHCGDLIYYDIPLPHKAPDIEEYRQKYLDAWGDCRPARKFLTQLPHYMILDDHEIVNNFANDMDGLHLSGSVETYRSMGVKVYREFVHIHNPQTYGNQALYYTFSYGDIDFFVMDTRTERFVNAGRGETRMVSSTQLQALLDWLLVHREQVKFIVSSVPFVGEVRNSDDKWCSALFRDQRERILRHLLEHDIMGVTFLTGDMHTSYHGTMEIKSHDGNKSITIHELMSSPINQLDKQTIDNYVTRSRKQARQGEFTYTAVLSPQEFYGDHSNAMLIQVDNRRVTYEIFRTKKDRRQEVTQSFQV